MYSFQAQFEALQGALKEFVNDCEQQQINNQMEPSMVMMPTSQEDMVQQMSDMMAMLAGQVTGQTGQTGQNSSRTGSFGTQKAHFIVPIFIDTSRLMS